MKKAFKIQCLIVGLFDKPYYTASVVFIAKEQQQAEKMAIEQTRRWFGIKKGRQGVLVTVPPGAVSVVDGVAGRLLVLMEHFRSVDIGVPVLGESTIVTLEDATEFKVETVSCQNGAIALSGYTSERWSQIPLDLVEEKDLHLIEEALEDTVGESSRPLLRQAMLLADLIGGESPYGNHIPSDILALSGDCDGVSATRVKDDTGNAVLLHWDYNGDFTRALVIPENEFECIGRVIEALESFVR